MDDKTVSLKEVLAEIDAMPPVKAEGQDFIEKTCLKIRLELLPSAQPTGTNTVQVDDCIGRQAAKDYIDSQKGRPFIGCTIGEAMKIMLDEVPPAQPKWIPCTPETMPDNEHDVLVTVEIRPVGRKPFRRVVRAFYTDGKHTDADSAYTWYELEEPDFDDDGNIIVPEGWWEAVDYSDEFNMIDDFVVAWREPLEPWEEEKDEGAATP